MTNNPAKIFEAFPTMPVSGGQKSHSRSEKSRFGPASPGLGSTILQMVEGILHFAETTLPFGSTISHFGDGILDIAVTTRRFGPPILRLASRISPFARVPRATALINPRVGDPRASSGQSPGARLSVVFPATALPLLSLATSSVLAQSNLVQNGGFESGNFVGWASSGNVVVINAGESHGSFASFSRNQTPNDGRLSQIVSTSPGRCYQLLFEYGAVDYSNSHPQRCEVRVMDAASTLAARTIGPVSYGGVYHFEPYALSFVASSVTTTIAFADTTTSSTFDADGILDNIRVYADPDVDGPASASACPSGMATFGVTSFGSGPFTYRWQAETSAGQWDDIQNGTYIGNPVGVTCTAASGATTPQLRLSVFNCWPSSYHPPALRCIVTNACGSVTSNPATLTICVADTDDGSGSGTCDGGVTIDDLLYYLRIFEEGAIASDVDDGTSTGTPDGGVTIDDLLYYLQRFEAGC